MKKLTNKGDKMETNKTATTTWLAINDEYEGTGPLFFNLDKPEILSRYLKNNSERKQNYTFTIHDLTEQEVSELNGEP